jgi:hypothetical protein
MKTLLFLPLLLLFSVPQQNAANDGPAVEVVTFKWFRARRIIEKPEAEVVTPAAAMIPANKNFQRNVRANDPMGVRDPNADTLDGRSAALEKSVQESRSSRARELDGFAYRVKVQNTGAGIIEVLFWEYQFIDPLNPNIIARRQFLCGVNIRPSKNKDLEGFSLSGPSEVVSVDTLARNDANPFRQKAIINRVEYSDGSIWQRKDWDFAEVKVNYQRVVNESWTPGMCKSL